MRADSAESARTFENMAKLLDVCVFPDPVLRAPTEKVADFGPSFQSFLEDLWNTMYLRDGVGLAAPQVGVSRKVTVVDAQGQKFVLANPEILEREGEAVAEEGCLSFPGIFVPVLRPTRIRLRYQNEQGDPVEREAVDFLARVFSHEIDHLNGRLLIDHVSPLRRQFIQRKLKKAASEADLS